MMGRLCGHAPLLPAACAALMVSCAWFGSQPVTSSDGDSDAPDGLEHDGAPGCTTDNDCDDTEPCNGAETCEAGECRDGMPLPDGADCVNILGADGTCRDELCIPDTCGDGVHDPGEECDDGNMLSGDGCDVTCLFSCHFNEDCDEDNACTVGLCNAGGSGRLCSYEPRAGPCDDGLFCTEGDHCSEDGMCVGTGDPCDDGKSCTRDECNEETDSCSYAMIEGHCLIEEVCYDEGDINAGNACRVCRSALDGRSWSLADAGSPCSDLYACTTGETCDESGACKGNPDHESCDRPGELCRPVCFPETPSGCGLPPSGLDVDCEDPGRGETTTVCGINLDGVEGQAACLACESESGVRLIDYSDFGSEWGSCDMDGWTPVESETCCTVFSGCRRRVCFARCCSDPDAICPPGDMGGQYLVGSAASCGVEEWEITKSFDTTGLENISMCLDIATRNGQDYAGVLVFAGDADHLEERVFCLDGDARAGVDDVFFPFCFDLPAWAGGNPGLEIRIVTHADTTEDGTGWVFIDNVRLKGWSAGCDPMILTAFEEDFSGCEGMVTDEWNGWDIEGSISCNGWGMECDAPSTGPSALAADSVTMLERTVDASALDGEVELCFALGNVSWNSNYVRVRFDAGGGDGWETAWYQEGDLGPLGDCANICVNLSDLDPGVNRNPALRIRFEFNSEGAFWGTHIIDDIVVRGAEFCDGSDYISLGAITEEGGGRYAVEAACGSEGRTSADIVCSWDSPPSPVQGSDTLTFDPGS